MNLFHFSYQIYILFFPFPGVIIGAYSKLFIDTVNEDTFVLFRRIDHPLSHVPSDKDGRVATHRYLQVTMEETVPNPGCIMALFRSFSHSGFSPLIYIMRKLLLVTDGRACLIHTALPPGSSTSLTPSSPGFRHPHLAIPLSLSQCFFFGLSFSRGNSSWVIEALLLFLFSTIFLMSHQLQWLYAYFVCV